MSRSLHHLLADGVLITHIAFVGFVVIGLVLILIGGLCGWSWVRNRWFRRAHLAAIGLVVLQAWLGIVCPLTTLEMHLREKAGGATYQGTFIAHWLHRLLFFNAHWLHRLLFFNAPPWVFTLCYTAFALAVIASWWLVRPLQHRAEE